jgi:hypothetical protein
MSNENTVVYGSPNDIVKMTTLKIAANSGHANPNIYANGRNMVRLDIQLEAQDKNHKVVTLSDADWVHITNLCNAGNSSERLSWQGSSGWCFTATPNDYAREIPSSKHPQQPHQEAEDGVYTLSYYVYADDVNTKEIAVSIDLDNGTHFDTCNTPVKSQTSKVQVTTIPAFIYSLKDIDVTANYNMNKAEADMRYWYFNGQWDLGEKSFDAHYDNYYVTLKNKYHINNYEFGCSGTDGNVVHYDSHADGQHMIVIHQQGKTGSATEGFTNRHNGVFTAKDNLAWREVDFFLTQTVDLNPLPGCITLSQLAFATNQVWPFPDGMGLDTGPFYYEQQNFSFYDDYGNYGFLKFDFTDDHSYIKFMD